MGVPVHGRLIYVYIDTSDSLLTQANPSPHWPPSPELRSLSVNTFCMSNGEPKSTRTF